MPTHQKRAIKVVINDPFYKHDLEISQLALEQYRAGAKPKPRKDTRELTEARMIMGLFKHRISINRLKEK